MRQLIKRYQHLQPVKMDDRDTKQQLPIHLVLGSGEYARIKTSTKPLVGKENEPIAEKTKLGWFIMSPGVEFDKSTMLLTQTSQADFEKLCRLDVLGIADSSEHDQTTVYKDFKENLTRDSTGWYEANLPWKPNHPPLPTNESGSRRRLDNLIKRLKRKNIYKQYDEIIQDQLEKGIVEPAPPKVSGKEFYIPHKGVEKQMAETTKLRIVYDASAKESNSQPSLNDCLNPGPPLQNLLWDILVRSRFHPVLLTGDIEKAFLQVRVKKEERDALRFHWRAPGSDVTSVYRFTRALFGLTCSPFLLGGVLNEHLKSWEERHPELVKEIRGGLYVDDLMIGGDDVKDVSENKTKAIEVFEDGTFHLHKWHSNVKSLEESERLVPELTSNDDETTFAKDQLGTSLPNAKLLGLSWDKVKDTLSVIMGKEATATTKRGALSHLAKVYDTLGLASPTTLTGKLLFRKMCEANIPWDGEFPEELQKPWRDRYENLPERLEVPRTLTPFHQPMMSLDLHAFGDASKNGLAAVVYAVVKQESGTTQGLVCSKSRVAKKNLTIPRLELVAGHMAANLVTNVKNAIRTEKVASVHCWLDSTVALYWINGQGEFRQFVANRVKKIHEHKAITWHHVPTDKNPADVGSRGGNVSDNELWRRGPTWLSDQTEWPEDVVITTSPEAEREIKYEQMAKVFTTVSDKAGEVIDEFMEKYDLRKTLRICAWIQRFVKNSRKHQASDRDVGPLKTTEVKNAEMWWIKRAQQEAQTSDGFETIKRELNLQENETKVLECCGRIQGEYPVYLPQSHAFTWKIVEQAHLATLHGGVGMTMARIRERFWIPKLPSLVKRVRSKCHGCVRFRTQAYSRPPPGNLPLSRTKGSTPFQVLGVDFAGPIRYQAKARTEKKAYLVLYGCSLTRAIHLDLLRSLQLGEFLQSLREFIARRGCQT